jgi:cell division protein FtsW (lipid II flippase)
MSDSFLTFLIILVGALLIYGRRLFILLRDGIRDTTDAELVEHAWKWDAFLTVGGTVLFVYSLGDYSHWHWDDWVSMALLVALMTIVLVCHVLSQYHLTKFKR